LTRAGSNRQAAISSGRGKPGILAQRKGRQCGRFDPYDLDRLHTTLRFLNRNADRSSIRDRALSEVPQDIGVQQNVRPTGICHDEPETFARIKPLHFAMHNGHGGIFFHHLEAVSPE
jgi:hypothetical protein